MSKHIQVQVPDPCHENWSQMTDTDKGRFCLSCSKEVIDFSMMTDQEILNHISKAAGGVCGRFNKEQLNRDMIMERKKRYSWYKYFVHVMIPALLVSNKSAAQERITGDIVVCSAPKDNSPELTGKVSRKQEINKPEKITIAGKVTDKMLPPIPGATIMIKGTRNGVVSDKDGDFKLKATRSILESAIIASCFGFEQKEFHVDLGEIAADLINTSLIMKDQSIRGTVGGVVVVAGYSVIKKKEKLSLLQPVKDSIVSFFINDTVKVYPNPVSFGSAINIDFDVKNAGEYAINIINTSGQYFFREKIILDSKKHTEQIICPAQMRPGIYFAEIVNPVSKKIYVNKILVQ